MFYWMPSVEKYMQSDCQETTKFADDIEVVAIVT
jgi:hypothetical protein